MIEADAYSALPRAALAAGDRPVDPRTWDKATVGLAAGLLQRAFRLDDGERETFLDLARHEARMRSAERWRGG